MLRLLLISLFCLSCAHLPPSRPPALVALVETDDALQLLRGGDGLWHPGRRLPLGARSVQLSANGRHLAWIEDGIESGRPLMQGFVWPEDEEKPTHLGTLGLHEVDAPGLAVSEAGEVAWVDEAGTLRLWPSGEGLGPGHSPLFDKEGLVWLDSKGCVRVRGAQLAESDCNRASALLFFEGGLLWMRTPQALLRIDSQKSRSFEASEVLRLASGPALALVQRTRREGRLFDSVSIDGVEILETALVISIAWDGDSLLVVGREQRRDIYELMLAHTPAEFGGERASGSAWKLSRNGDREPIAGLPPGRVRLLRRL